jgi:hypothetical protein
LPGNLFSKLHGIAMEPQNAGRIVVTSLACCGHSLSATKGISQLGENYGRLNRTQ